MSEAILKVSDVETCTALSWPFVACPLTCHEWHRDDPWRRRRRQDHRAENDLRRHRSAKGSIVFEGREIRR